MILEVHTFADLLLDFRLGVGSSICHVDFGNLFIHWAQSLALLLEKLFQRTVLSHPLLEDYRRDIWCMTLRNVFLASSSLLLTLQIFPRLLPYSFAFAWINALVQDVFQILLLHMLSLAGHQRQSWRLRHIFLISWLWRWTLSSGNDRLFWVFLLLNDYLTWILSRYLSLLVPFCLKSIRCGRCLRCPCQIDGLGYFVLWLIEHEVLGAAQSLHPLHGLYLWPHLGWLLMAVPKLVLKDPHLPTLMLCGLSFHLFRFVSLLAMHILLCKLEQISLNPCSKLFNLAYWDTWRSAARLLLFGDVDSHDHGWKLFLSRLRNGIQLTLIIAGVHSQV